MPDVLQYFSAARVFEDIQGIYNHVRWCSGQAIFQAGDYIACRLRAVPQLKVELRELPADGRSMHGGWVMPKAWDVKQATLSIVAPEVKDGVLADYQKNPHSLMMWSPPTPDGALEAEVVRVKDHTKFSGSLRGRFAFVENLPGIGVQVLEWAAQRGAVGLLSDNILRVPKIKDGPYLDYGAQYFNYVNPQWDGPRRLPAFTLTPERGRILRALLSHGCPVRLRAVVESILYDGRQPLVLASLPGESNKEFVLTAHMDEPGASDNCSGAALAMEVLRALAAFTQARGRKLSHTVRLMLSSEVRGMQYYLNTTKDGRRVIAGLDLDMLGYEQRAGRTRLRIYSVQPQAPSYLEPLLGNLVAAEARRAPRWKWEQHRAVYVNDCHFSTLPFHAPMCALEQCPDRTYHTSLDTPENLSVPHLKRIGGVITQAVLFVADPQLSELRKLAGTILEGARRQLRRMSRTQKGQKLPDAKPPRTPAAILADARMMWKGLSGIIPALDAPVPHPPTLARWRREAKLIRGYLSPSAAFEEEVDALEAELQRLVAVGQASCLSGDRRDACPTVAQKDGRAWREAQALVPLKKFAGYLGFEDCSPEDIRRLHKQTGITFSWGAPGWLQWALDLSNGKRTVAEIATTLNAAGKPIDVAHLIAALRFLAGSGKVHFRPVLSKADILSAVRRAGIKAGDVIMAHTALSEFGYVAGGGEAVIDAMLEAVGPRGTLCVPTHTYSLVSRRPYDARTSPSVVGAITNLFLKRPGVLRSAHPTHSCAALGPRAAELIAGHTAACAPQGREGFWGNFVRADGKVLLLCPLGSDTLLHAADLWAGVPYPPVPAHFIQAGRRVEQIVPNAPFHTTSFPAIHAKMNERKQIREVKLGESTLRVMRARDAIATALPIMRRKPLLATLEGCECLYCRYVRKQVARH